MAAKEPPNHDDPGQPNPPADQIGSDVDAEGEEETDIYHMDQQLQDAVHRAYSGEDAEEDGDNGANADASYGGEGGSDNGEDNEETAPVGAVKLPGNDDPSDEEEAESDTADADGDPAFEDDNDQPASEHSESESEVDEEWEAESNGREDEDPEADIRSRSNCLCVGHLPEPRIWIKVESLTKAQILRSRRRARSWRGFRRMAYLRCLWRSL